MACLSTGADLCAAGPALRAALMRAIVPIELAIETVDGTWKLNQNKPEKVRRCAAEHVAAEGFGQGSALLAALMREAYEVR